MSLDVIEAGIVLQQCSIVHGDLRTDNLLVSRAGRAVFGDFGVARLAQAVGASTTSTTTAPGATTRVAPAKKRKYWLAPENSSKTEGKTHYSSNVVCLKSCLLFITIM